MFVCQRFFHANEVGIIVEEPVVIKTKIDITGPSAHYIILCFDIHPIIKFTSNFYACLNGYTTQ